MPLLNVDFSELLKKITLCTYYNPALEENIQLIKDT